MRLLPLALLPLVLLAGCVGQLRDFVGPVSNTTSPQLLRFGLDLTQARCVGDKLGERLRPRQLRMFARAASAVHDGWFEPGRITLRDLNYLANHDPDAAFGPALTHALGACNVAPPPPLQAGSPGNVVTGLTELPPPGGAATAGAPRAPTWLNLGAAGSGQSIAINASTIDEQGSRREAWFRLTDPGAPPSQDSFLLEIDCGHRTINAKVRERRDATGAVIQHVDYPANPLPVEGGTVMEIAWLSLCT